MLDPVQYREYEYGLLKQIVVLITVIHKYILDEVLAASDEKAENKKIKQ